MLTKVGEAFAEVVHKALRINRTIIHIASYNYLVLGTGAAGSVVLARALGPTALGQTAAVVTWLSFTVYLGSLGIPSATVYFLAQGNRRAAVWRVARRIFALQSLVVTIIAGLVFLLAFHGPIRRLGLWYAIVTPALLWSFYILAALQGMSLFRRWNRLRTLYALGPILGGVVFGLIGGTAGWALVGYAVGATGGAVFSAPASAALTVGWCTGKPAPISVADNPLPSPRSRRLSVATERNNAQVKGLASSMLRYGLLANISGVANAANISVDQAVLALVAAPRSLGVYSTAAALSTVGIPVSSALASYALARIPALHTDDANHLIRRLSMLNVCFLFCYTIVGASFAGRAISLVYGPRFASGGKAARILFFAAAPLGLNILLRDMWRALGRPGVGVAGDVAGLGVTAIGLTILLPRLGYIGAAWTSLAAYSASTLVFLIGGTLLRHRVARLAPEQVA